MILSFEIKGVRANNPLRIISQESNNLLMYQNNYQKKNSANRELSTACKLIFCLKFGLLITFVSLLL